MKKILFVIVSMFLVSCGSNAVNVVKNKQVTIKQIKKTPVEKDFFKAGVTVYLVLATLNTNSIASRCNALMDICDKLDLKSAFISLHPDFEKSCKAGDVNAVHKTILAQTDNMADEIIKKWGNANYGIWFSGFTTAQIYGEIVQKQNSGVIDAHQLLTPAYTKHLKQIKTLLIGFDYKGKYLDLVNSIINSVNKYDLMQIVELTGKALKNVQK